MRRSEYFTLQMITYLSLAIMSLPSNFSNGFDTRKTGVVKAVKKVAVKNSKAVDFKDELLFRY